MITAQQQLVSIHVDPFLLLGQNFGCISNSLRYGLVVRISGSHPGGPGSIPGNGKLFSIMVKRLGYLALTQVAQVRNSPAELFSPTFYCPELQP